MRARAMLAGAGALLLASGAAMAQDQAAADPIATCTNSTAANLSFNRAVNGELTQDDGRLNNGEFRDPYTFQGRAGQQVDIVMESETFDTYVFVRGPNGFSRDNDDDGTIHRSRITVALPADGQYYVYATSFAAGSTGRYRLTVRSSDPRPQLAVAPSCAALIDGGALSQFDLARALTRRSSLTPNAQNDAAFTDADRAVSILRGLGEPHPNELATALYWRAWTYGVRNDRPHQIDDLNAAIQANPGYESAYLALGNLYVAQGDAERANAAFGRAIQAFPNSALGHYGLGSVRQNVQHDAQGAIDEYAAALRIDPNLVWAHVNLAQLVYFLDHSRFEEAVAHFEQALRIAPNLSVTGGPATMIAGAFVERSNAAFGRGDIAGTLAAANRAIALDPNNAYAYNNRGAAYNHQGNLTAALADFDTAVRLAPQLQLAASNRASVQQALAQQQAQQQQAQQQQAQQQAQADAEARRRRAAGNQALGRLLAGGLAAAMGANRNTVAQVLQGQTPTYSPPPPRQSYTPAPQPQRQAPGGGGASYTYLNGQCVGTGCPQQGSSGGQGTQSFLNPATGQPCVTVIGQRVELNKYHILELRNSCPRTFGLSGRVIPLNGGVPPTPVRGTGIGANSTSTLTCSQDDGANSCAGWSEWWLSAGAEGTSVHYRL